MRDVPVNQSTNQSIKLIKFETYSKSTTASDPSAEGTAPLSRLDASLLQSTHQSQSCQPNPTLHSHNHCVWKDNGGGNGVAEKIVGQIEKSELGKLEKRSGHRSWDLVAACRAGESVECGLLALGALLDAECTHQSEIGRQSSVKRIVIQMTAETHEILTDCAT